MAHSKKQNQIAVVGSGISGLLCARLLATKHDVVLFEASDRLGGHTYTVDVEAFGKTWAIDTGFMVFNDHTYPNFVRMLKLLGIEAQQSDMSFSVRCDRTGLEYQGSSLNGLFAQRRNLLRPRFYRMLSDVLRFNRSAPQLLDSTASDISLQDYLHEQNYTAEFANHYLLPMTAAIWSAPAESMGEFPAQFLVQFLQNHGLLQIRNRPPWQTIPGGARRYVETLVNPLGDAVRIGSRVTSVQREEDGVAVTVNHGQAERFDQVIFASHAPQTLEILADATPLEKEILGAFRYQANLAYLHTDQSLLPRRRRAWASWNYLSAGDTQQPVSVTYDLSRLQKVRSPTPLLLTLNPTQAPKSDKVLKQINFQHPLFDHQTRRAQCEHDKLHKQGKVFYCGAYWGYGFHEDGVVSALKVCKHFDLDLDDVIAPCKVASTKAG